MMQAVLLCFAFVYLYSFKQGVCHQNCLNEYCDGWAALGKCHRDPHWMHTNCSKYCRAYSPSIHSLLNSYKELAKKDEKERPIISHRILYDRHHPKQSDVAYFVQFNIDPIFEDSYICGGTLIGKQVVLTAAHCLANYLTNIGKGNDIIYIGSTEMFGGHQFVINKVFLHPEYDSQSDEKDESLDLKEMKIRISRHTIHDLAIVTIVPMSDEEEINWNGNENIQILEVLDTWTKMKDCEYTGIRLNKQNDNGKRIYTSRHVVQLKLPSVFRCPIGYKLKPNTMCTMGYLCVGDFGGTLICKVNGVKKIFGVGSRSTNSDCLMNPGNSRSFYTNATYNFDWIRSTLSKIQNEDTDKKEGDDHDDLF